MTAPQFPRFAVVTDGGLDAFAGLGNDVSVAPFSLNFGDRSYRMDTVTHEWLYRELATNPLHLASSQPTPQDWADAYRRAGQRGLPVLALTISSGHSGSRNAAEQALTLVPEHAVTIHDTGTLSAAQAFQVHAAVTAAGRGETLDTALDWMRRTHEETELYFSLETLEYLRRGGRIGRVQATLGGLLNLKPVITVDKQAATYTNVGRARSYRGPSRRSPPRSQPVTARARRCGWVCFTAVSARTPTCCWPRSRRGIRSSGRASRRSTRS